MEYHGASNLKKDFYEHLKQFKKIYVHNEGDMGGENFVKNACKVFPYDKLYVVSSKKVNPQCKDPSDLHLAGIFDADKFLATAQKVDKDFYDSINNEQKEKEKKDSDKLDEHVKIAEEIMKKLYIRYYRENFYVYQNGVYKKNLPLIEQTILSIDKNIKKHLRQEVLDYIRIQKITKELEINEQFVNFKNGLYDLVNNRLVAHSPAYFTTCQINANYFNDMELEFNKDIELFLNSVTSNNMIKKRTLLEIVGYCMTFKTDLELAFFFYRTNSK